VVTALGDEDAGVVAEVLVVPTPLLQTSFFPDLIHVNTFALYEIFCW
jgi:hypothetical protein